ncbi:MAG: hypothetical protein WBV28_24610 [Terracidiphilus sp.]
MDLLERYLQAVKKHLPGKKQDDILAELRANLEAQLEDKEAELGRPLAQGEMEDWLRAMGPPILVASRYQPQQYLIGPALYPVYLYVLRVSAFWAIIIYTVVNAVVIPLTSPTGESAMEAVLRAPGVLITVAAWVTLIFAAVEFAAARFPEKCSPIAGLTGKWSPSSLPPLEKDTPQGKKPRSFATAVAEVTFEFLFLVWLLLIPQHPFLVMGPGVVFLDAGPFQLAQAWWTFFWWIVALSVLQIAWHSVDLARGTWRHRSKLEHIAVKVFGLAPLVLMLDVRDKVYVLLKNPAVDRAHYGSALESINKSVHLGLLVVTTIVALQLAWEIAQAMVQISRGRAAAH